MEPENQNQKNYSLPISIVVGSLIIAGAWLYTSGNPLSQKPKLTATLIDKIIPQKGVVLPAIWGDLGKKLAASGAIDAKKFEELLTSRGEFNEETKNMLSGSNNQKIKITPQNANTLLNFFWALGLANKNEILEQGPMVKYNGNAGQFASTGGWPLSIGTAMDHYSMHPLINLTPEQQALVKETSQNIYRPCCDNSVYFPDCNHGMAMLGLLELMASQGANKEDMYKAALAVNSYWFPDQYLTIAKYLASKNIEFDKASPDKILGSTFSSASGFAQVQSKITEPAEEHGGGGSCGA